MPRGKKWPDEKVERLKKLWKEGLSPMEISLQMGDACKNAVIGKAHRLGISASKRVVDGLPNPNTRTYSPGPLKACLKTVLPCVRLEDTEPLVADSVSVVNVKDAQCRWPVDRPGTEGMQFCGQPKDGPNKAGVRSAYCAAHRAEGTQASQGRKGNGKWIKT